MKKIILLFFFISLLALGQNKTPEYNFYGKDYFQLEE
jgi:hypothetical protein